MNFEQIKSFMSVANTGNYSAAAKERFITQPAISNQIKGLEEELGAVLFVRNSKNVTLTEKGQMFYQYATKLVATEKDILNDMKATVSGRYGNFDILFPWLTIRELVDRFFVKLIQQKGEIATFRMMEAEDTKISEMILNGKAEVGVCNYILKNSNLVYEPAFTEEIVLITPNAEKYRNLNPEQIKQILLTEGHIRYDWGEGPDFLWNDFFGKIIGEDLHNIRTVATTTQYQHQLAAVESGLGIGFISSICYQKKRAENTMLAYRCPGLLQKTHYVVYDKARAERSELIQYTKDLLRSELEKSIKNPELSF